VQRPVTLVRVRPPLTLDIGWSDLLSAAFLCLVPLDPAQEVLRFEAAWSAKGDAIAGLTVRTLFDAWLRVRSFEPGDEILMTGFTLPDMARVVRENGLVPVSVDLDPRTMCPTELDLDRVRTARTRAVVVAHLFGGRADLAATVAWAARHGVDVVEDAAQAYAADGWNGSRDVALSLFSFGTIKTATALGGGVARVADRAVREEMRSRLNDAPAQPRGEFLSRVARAAVLRVLASPPVYGGFVRGCELLGRGHAGVVGSATRSIRSVDFVAAIRRRPSAPLMALLARRLLRPPSAHVARRAARGESVVRRLGDRVLVPGSGATVRTHWLLPVCVDDLPAVLARLRSAGLDAAPAGSVVVIGEAPRLRAMAARLLYVPVSPRLGDAEIERIAAAVL